MLESTVSAVVKIGATRGSAMVLAKGAGVAAAVARCWCASSLVAAAGRAAAGRSVAAANLQPALAHKGGVGAQPLGILAAGG